MFGAIIDRRLNDGGSLKCLSCATCDSCFLHVSIRMSLNSGVY